MANRPYDGLGRFCVFSFCNFRSFMRTCWFFFGVEFYRCDNFLFFFTFEMVFELITIGVE